MRKAIPSILGRTEKADVLVKKNVLQAREKPKANLGENRA